MRFSAIAIILMAPELSWGGDAPPTVRQVTVLKNNTIRLQMTGKQPIAKVTAEPSVIRIEKGDKDTFVQVTGLAQGQARLVLTDAAGKSETIEVTVESNQLFLTVGSTIRLQLTTKEPIAQVINEKDLVARVSPSGDPTTVLVTGLAPGITRITLIGADGRSETRESGKK